MEKLFFVSLLYKNDAFEIRSEISRNLQKPIEDIDELKIFLNELKESFLENIIKDNENLRIDAKNLTIVNLTFIN